MCVCCPRDSRASSPKDLTLGPRPEEEREGQPERRRKCWLNDLCTGRAGWGCSTLLHHMGTAWHFGMFRRRLAGGSPAAQCRVQFWVHKCFRGSSGWHLVQRSDLNKAVRVKLAHPVGIVYRRVSSPSDIRDSGNSTPHM